MLSGTESNTSLSELRPPFNHIFRKPYVLLLLAVIFFSISFFFTTDYSQRTSVDREVARLETYLHTREQDFLHLLRDTVLIQRLAGKKESLEEFEQIIKKPYGIYLYRSSSLAGNKLVFWSNQMQLPSEENLASADGEYFQHMSNGYYVCYKKNFSLANQLEWISAFALIPIQ